MPETAAVAGTSETPETGTQEQQEQDESAQAPESSPAANAAPVGRYVAKLPFQDAREYATTSTPQQYAVGEDVGHFEQARLDNAVALGTVEFVPN